MSRGSRYTLTDLLVAAISPVLIMALVGSLVFFLIEVGYDGAYPFQVQWIFFFFVFGSVLVSRISMSGEVGWRSGLYGVVLAGVAFLALQMFVDYSKTPLGNLSAAINLALVLLVWWCAYQLTWDCTYLDTDAEAGGQGVLDAAVAKPADDLVSREAPPSADSRMKGEKRPSRKKKRATRVEPVALYIWWQRYCKYRDEKSKKRSPGTWVVYFSLAALPLFGLGQARIPLEDGARRQYTFWLMVCYAGSARGLLLATQFLGLRRYLRQRGVKMPGSIIARWLTLGVVSIVSVLAVAALLPRPWPEYTATDLLTASSQDKEPGRGKGKGKEGDQGETQPDSSASIRGSGNHGSSSGSGSSAGDGSSRASGEPTRSGSDERTTSGRTDSRSSGTPPKPPRPAQPQWLASLGPLATILKWIVIVIVVLVVAVVFLKSFLGFMANFTGWAARLLQTFSDWWNRLFGLGKRSHQRAETETVPVAKPVRPFAYFTNPFADGSAPGMSPEELVRHTFAAVEAWAAERDLGRHQDETPLEFTTRLSGHETELQPELERLAELYSRMAYASYPLSDAVRPGLRALWEQMHGAAALSA